jgi:hypothetical protein
MRPPSTSSTALTTAGKVREMVVGDDRISYMVLCEYPDGKRVVGSYVCDLSDGKITRMVGHVSWDE